MSLLKRFRAWRQHRRYQKHIEWLRRNRILMDPAYQVKRNSTEAVP